MLESTDKHECLIIKYSVAQIRAILMTIYLCYL